MFARATKQYYQYQFKHKFDLMELSLIRSCKLLSNSLTPALKFFIFLFLAISYFSSNAQTCSISGLVATPNCIGTTGNYCVDVDFSETMVGPSGMFNVQIGINSFGPFSYTAARPITICDASFVGDEGLGLKVLVSDIDNAPSSNPFISEFHYDNAGGDVGEFIEISGVTCTDISDYQLELYNGTNGTVYNTVPLTGIIPDEGNGCGALSFPISGIQNGAPDGFALVQISTGLAIEFWSYEGTINATSGSATGMTSVDVGVAETGTTPIGSSIEWNGATWIFNSGTNTEGLYSGTTCCIGVASFDEPSCCIQQPEILYFKTISICAGICPGEPFNFGGGTTFDCSTYNWYSDTLAAPVFSNNTNFFDPFGLGLIDSNVPGDYEFYLQVGCTNGCVEGFEKVPFYVLDCDTPPDGCGACTYILELIDEGRDGWDGASLLVSVNEEWPPKEYKLAPQDCGYRGFPIDINDGGLIDITYVSGANDSENGYQLTSQTELIVKEGVPSATGQNIIPGITNRYKAACVECCEDPEEEFIFRVTAGTFPADYSWEIRNRFGLRKYFKNAGTYATLGIGSSIDETIFLDPCETYDITAFDAFNNGWTGGTWEIISTNPCRGTPFLFEAPDELRYLIASGPGPFTDQITTRITLPCKPECPAEETILADDLVNCEANTFVPTLIEPSLCYPNSCHGPTVTEIIYEFANGNTGSGPQFIPPPFTVTGIPVGVNKLIYETTYGDGQIVRCTTTLNVISTENPTLTCNDLVNVTLLQDLDECETIVTPDHVLENTGVCEDQFEVIIEDQNGTEIGNTVNTTHAGQTLTYVVRQIGSNDNNICWGELFVEDKDAPILECFEYTIPCHHPERLDEFWEHTEVFVADSTETPANIAGGTAATPSVTTIPIPSIGCAPLGEIIYDVNVKLALEHSDLEDLQIELLAPDGTSVILMQYGNCTAGFFNMDVTFNSDSPTPVSTACVGMNPGLSGNLEPQQTLDVFNNLAYQQLEGTWFLVIRDNDNTPNNGVIGFGQVNLLELELVVGFPQPYSVYDCSLEGIDLLEEVIEETNCDQSDWVGSRIKRTWQAVDLFDNVSSCVQYVNLRAPSFDDLVLPGDIDLECEGLLPEEITPMISGEIQYDCFIISDEDQGTCDVSFTFDDNVLPTCGDGYKIIRDWTIINWCSGTTKHHTQTIKVEDTTGPEIIADNFIIESNSGSCESAVIFSNVGTDICSGINLITAEFSSQGGAYNGNGSLIIEDITNGGTLDGLPLGMVEIKITAVDGCNNQTVVFITVDVIDTKAPTAICDDDFHVSLNNDGLAWIAAEDFDEGSTDNCSEVTLEIRSLGCLADEWGPSAEVSCCDDPNVVLELRVTDDAGNTNICWAEITIEDPIAPIVICKPDLTVDCNEIITGGDGFTAPEVTDNCTPELINTVDGGSLDNCHAGTLTRTWTYSDGSDKSADASCTQRITFVHVSDFTVQFPPDITIDTCPDDTGDTGAPIILDDDCELVAINFEDQLLTITDDASCFKIRRTWTLINWCVFDDSQTPTDGGIPLPLPNTFRDDDGYFQYVQEIKVIDEDAPTVTMEIPDPCDFTDGCEGFVELIAVGSDDCSTDLEYNYVIDAFSDGGSDITGTGDDASGVYPYGCHLITWNVGDNCGNWVSETFEFCVEDCKNPTPVCLNGISVEVMNDGDGCVSIPGAHLLEYAFDNCDEDEDIEASVLIRRVGDTGPPQTAIEVCCADVPGGIVNVEIWVTDSAGNSDFCETYIIPQDNLGNCPGSGGGSAAIKGDIVTEDFEDVDQVMVDINGSASANGITGEYFYPNLIVGSSYTVTPGKDIQPLNGVSTYDLVLISQHIIGTAPLTSPYQMIAADVNNSGSISTFDLVQLRQLILFVIADFPSNTSWRFVDMDYVFPVPTNPWSQTFPEFINVASLPLNGELLADFFAIKVGDVNGTANPNTLLGTNDREMPTTLVLNVDDTEMVAGETYRVDFLANDFTDINGYQFTMNFDRSVVEFVGTKGGALNVGEKNFGTTLLDEGVITTSFNEATAMTVENDETLFSVTFKAKVNASLSEVININSMYTPAESYNDAGEIMDVAIGFNTNNGLEIAGGAFELMQNKPNPFNEITVIGFNLPESAEVTLKIMNVAGKTLKVIKGDFERGYNETTFNRNDLDATGVLYYQLDTQGFTETKKMILID